MFIFCYRGASEQCQQQTKTAVFLTTRHFIPNFYFKINTTRVKDDLNYLLYREQNKKNNEMKNK